MSLGLSALCDRLAFDINKLIIFTNYVKILSPGILSSASSLISSLMASSSSEGSSCPSCPSSSSAGEKIEVI